MKLFITEYIFPCSNCILQICLCVLIYLQINPIKRQNILINEQTRNAECQGIQDRYFQIYRYYRDDIDKLETPIYASMLEGKLKTEMKRIASNTIRHFSFERDNQFLVIKALESALSYTYPERQKISNLRDKQKRFLASIGTEDKESILKDVLELLREDNSKWPMGEEYASWKSHQPCF